MFREKSYVTTFKNYFNSINQNFFDCDILKKQLDYEILIKKGV